MATEKDLLVIETLPAAADLSAKQFYFVKRSSGAIAAITAVTDVPYGVLQNKPSAAGKPAEVLRLGISKMSADGAVTEGALIGPSADGQADAKVPGTDVTNYVGGMAREAVSNAGEIFSASINCMAPFRAA